MRIIQALKSDTKSVILSMTRNIDAGETIKAVFLGDSMVGKTSIVGVIHGAPFIENQAPTVGACFHVEKYEFEDVQIRLNIWDTAGQERFRSLAPMYYRDANIIMLVYSVDDRNSFEKLDEWYESIKYQCKALPKIVLIGNKIDLEEDRVVSTEEGNNIAKKYEALFFEVSAKENPAGIKLMMDRIGKEAAREIKSRPKVDTNALAVVQPEKSNVSPCC